MGPGTVLAGRYTLEREVGRGGMATVYLAADSRHRRSVAVKVLRPELAVSLGSQRFLREIEIAAQLTHPHILPLHDSGEAGGLLYYVMPFVEGESLRERLRRDGRLPADEARRIAREVADALAYAHSRGVVHRDIKPGNILLESGHAVVADFGIARALSEAGGEELTTSGLAIGTPMYMSPEQISGTRVDGRSDIYSLGCVLHEMVMGEPPFKGPSAAAVAARQLYEDPALLSSTGSEVPPDIKGAIRKALAKAPANRFPDAAAFAEALETSGTRPVRARPAIRRAWIYAATAAVTVPAIAFLWQYGGQLERPHPPAWVLVSDFEGSPGSGNVPDAVRELVTAELDQSRYVATMPRQQLRSVMRDAGLPDSASLTPERARELALRSSVRAFLSGNVQTIRPGQYSIVVRATDAEDEKPILTASASATDQNLVSIAQELGRQVRRGLGERRSEIESNKPLTQVATPSFEAYRKYVDALELSEAADVEGSNRMLREALALDSGFASAWATMASNFQTMRNLDSTAFALAQALRRPTRLSQAQLYRLRADSAYALEYDISGAVRWYDLLLQTSPQSLSGHNNRAVFLYSLGRYEEALAGFRRTEELEPFGIAQAQIEIFNQAVTLLALGRVAEAEATTTKLRGLFAEYAVQLIATSRGKWITAESHADRLAADPSTPGWLKTPAVTMLAGARAARGDVETADRQLRLAAAAAEGSVRHWFCNAVLLLASASGRPAGRVPSWLLSDTTAGGLLSAGLWAAAARDTPTAQERLRILEQRPVIQQRRLGQGLVLLRAYLLGSSGRWNESSGSLRPAAMAGELDGGDLDQVSGMALRWLMAQAYERTGKADSAAAMYQLVLDPTRTPFSHLALRGLVYSFATRRIAELQRQGVRPPT